MSQGYHLFSIEVGYASSCLLIDLRYQFYSFFLEHYSLVTFLVTFLIIYLLSLYRHHKLIERFIIHKLISQS